MHPANQTGLYAQTRAAKKILVVDLGFLGDTIHLVPALWEIKRHYPQGALHVLTSTLGAETLKLAPCADRAWAVELRPSNRTLRQQWHIVRALRRERFDVAFNFSGADRSIFMTALSGARWRVGHRAGRWHFWNRWLVPNWVPRQDPNLIVFEQRRQVLAACGFSLAAPRFDLNVDENAAKWAAGIVPPAAVHLSINAAKAVREWPLEHHAAFLRSVWKEHSGLHVLVSAGAKERERQRLRALAAQVGDSRLRLLPDSLSITQLAAVLLRCRLHIGPDSGVLQLAMALNVPTISFFREQGAYKSFMPTGPAHRVICVACSCVDHHASPCESLGRAECLARIDPARVAALVREQLAARR